MRGLFRNLTLVCLVAALLGHFSAPDFPGFAVLPLAAALLCAVLAGPAQWRRDFTRLTAPAGRTGLRAVTIAVLTLAVLLAVGALKALPVFNLGPGNIISLSPATLELLGRLDRRVNVVINLGPQDPHEARLRELAAHYARNSSGRMHFTFINPQTNTINETGGPRLVENDTALVEAESFRENISPVSETTINSALTRLLIPERRLVYFLNTFGEKMVSDRGPNGLSGWAEDLGGQRIVALDHYWPEGAPIPAEASAVVLAGPKAPLGGMRETMLLNYIKNGGRVMIMADPLTVAVSPEFWHPFGLENLDGLVVDPESNLAGTGETFVISNDYPSHPMTHGLSQPILWPLAGAFFTLNDDGYADFPTETYALAMSSFASWLETDPGSLSDGSLRYQPDADKAGPLVLAAASALNNGGRLLALADSDLAVNNFRGFTGNRNFTSAAVHWLLDGEAAPPVSRDQTRELIFTHISARLVFWLPVVVWPLGILGVWALFIRRKRY
ncbi:hypothetical protein C4J81_13225 [Deltaproteobacteria bacterium Smac51]|nr:hypothetical protein C4J81_13225 [Deltaproteobacteria bacterium Smac51]